MRTWADWASETIADHMAKDPKAFLYGVGVGDGETWACGLGRVPQERFPERVWDTPICEAVLTGMGIGMSDMGWHPILVHCRAQFSLLAEDMYMNHGQHWLELYDREVSLKTILIDGDVDGQGPQHRKYGFPLDYIGPDLADHLKRGTIIPLSLSWLRTPCE